MTWRDDAGHDWLRSMYLASYQERFHLFPWLASTKWQVSVNVMWSTTSRSPSCCLNKTESIHTLFYAFVIVYFFPLTLKNKKFIVIMRLSSVFIAGSLMTMSGANPTKSKEAHHVREYFYVGGNYVTTSSGSLFQNQMYVEKLTPPRVSQQYPIVFLHGGAQTGTVSYSSSNSSYYEWFTLVGARLFWVQSLL